MTDNYDRYILILDTCINHTTERATEKLTMRLCDVLEAFRFIFKCVALKASDIFKFDINAHHIQSTQDHGFVSGGDT